MSGDRIIAQVRVLNYGELIGLLRRRVEALGIPHVQLEQHMRLTGGLLGKLLGVAEVRRIGLDNIWKILDGLGYQMAIIEHLDIAAAIDEIGSSPSTKRGPPRGRLRMTLSPAIIHAAAQQYGAMGRGKPKTFRISRKQLSRKQKKASRARWAKHWKAAAMLALPG